MRLTHGGELDGRRAATGGLRVGGVIGWPRASRRGPGPACTFAPAFPDSGTLRGRRRKVVLALFTVGFLWLYTVG